MSSICCCSSATFFLSCTASASCCCSQQGNFCLSGNSHRQPRMGSQYTWEKHEKDFSLHPLYFFQPSEKLLKAQLNSSNDYIEQIKVSCFVFWLNSMCWLTSAVLSILEYLTNSLPAFKDLVWIYRSFQNCSGKQSCSKALQ